MKKMEKNLSEKQKRARLLITEYFRQLPTQERLVERIFDQKWNEMSAFIEQTIDRKIEEKFQAQA